MSYYQKTWTVIGEESLEVKELACALAGLDIPTHAPGGKQSGSKKSLRRIEDSR